MSTPDLGPRLVHVAVVDDVTFYRDWLGQARTLPAHHHIVARAGDAEQMAALLSKLPDQRCDVIVLDLRLSTVPRVDPDTEGQGQTTIQGSSAVELLLATAQRAVGDGLLATVPAVLIYTQE